MSDSDQAEAKADAAKARLLSTAEQVKARLAPDLLKRDATDALASKINALADSIGEAAAKRPAVTATVSAGLAFILLHKPIRWIMRSLYKEK